jgi:hypothetical protein
MTIDFGMAYVPAEGGYLVSERHARIAEIIQDYDETLELTWIPPDKREPGDKPFAVVHRPDGQPPYIVCYSDDPDERLLARIFSGDATKTNVLDDIEALNAANQALKLKAELEAAEERQDVIEHIIRSPKTRYKHNGVIYE